MAKANFEVNGKEITVLFHIEDGEVANCFYCHRNGAVEQLAIVEEIDVDGVRLSSRSKLFVEAEARLKQLMFSGRPLHVGKSCERKWATEFHAHQEAEIVMG